MEKTVHELPDSITVEVSPLKGFEWFKCTRSNQMKRQFGSEQSDDYNGSHNVSSRSRESTSSPKSASMTFQKRTGLSSALFSGRPIGDRFREGSSGSGVPDATEGEDPGNGPDCRGAGHHCVRLAGLLEAEQVPARPVPLYLPVRIVQGRIQGVVRLKQVAAAGGLGSLGRNTVLLTPRFGPRLLLSGVVSGRRIQESRQGESSAGRKEAPLCKGCGRCIRACPGGALGPEGVDAFRCRDVSAWVPPILVPAAKWILGRSIVQKCMAPLAPWFARRATMPCSLCVTECPNFSGDEGKDKATLPQSSH